MTGEIRRLTPNGQAQRSIPTASNWNIVRAPEGEEEFSTEGVVTAVHVPSASAKTGKTRRTGLFFELTFDAPVAFPMPALGHSGHFGLGLFVPAPMPKPKPNPARERRIIDGLARDRRRG